MAYYKLRNSPDVYEVGADGSRTYLSADEFAKRGNPFAAVQEIGAWSDVPNPTGGGQKGPISPPGVNTPAPGGDLDNPKSDGVPVSSNSGAGGVTNVYIGDRDTKPWQPPINFKLDGGGTPVQQRTAQGLNLNRPAPTAFQPRGVNIDPGQATQTEGYRAPGARQGPQAFQRQSIQVPPPPRPPQPPGAATMGPQYQTAAGAYQGEALSPDLTNFAREWMSAPNRYATPWMESVRKVIDADAERGRAEGQRAIAEQMAARGVVGSGMEFTEDVKLENQLDQNRLRQLADLYEQMATVDAQDRLAAGQFGLGVGEFQRGLGQDRVEEGRFQHEADRQRARDFEGDTLDRYRAALEGAQFEENANMDRARFTLEGQDLDLRAHQIQQDAIQRGQEMDLQEARDRASAELGRSQLSEQGRQFNVGTRVDQAQFNETVAQRAHQIQQDAIQRGQEMDLQEAMDQARRQVDLDRLAVEERRTISDERLRELALLLQGLQAFG